MSPAPNEGHQERDRIRAAMDRILAGTAENSNGALTIVALAHEAGVPRNALTQRNTDLKTEFYTRVRERDGTSEVEDQLRKTITRLKNTIANKNTELKGLRADVPALVRTINMLTLETTNFARRASRTSQPSYRSDSDRTHLPWTNDPISAVRTVSRLLTPAAHHEPRRFRRGQPARGRTTRLDTGRGRRHVSARDQSRVFARAGGYEIGW